MSEAVTPAEQIAIDYGRERAVGVGLRSSGMSSTTKCEAFALVRSSTAWLRKKGQAPIRAYEPISTITSSPTHYPALIKKRSRLPRRPHALRRWRTRCKNV